MIQLTPPHGENTQNSIVLRTIAQTDLFYCVHMVLAEIHVVGFYSLLELFAPMR